MDEEKVRDALKGIYLRLAAIVSEIPDERMRTDIANLGTTIRETIATHNPTLVELASQDPHYEELRRVLIEEAEKGEGYLRRYVRD